MSTKLLLPCAKNDRLLKKSFLSFISSYVLRIRGDDCVSPEGNVHFACALQLSSPSDLLSACFQALTTIDKKNRKSPGGIDRIVF